MTLSELLTEWRSLIGQTDSSNSLVTDTQGKAWANEGYRTILAKMNGIPTTSRDYSSAADTITLNSLTLEIMAADMLKQPENKYSPLSIVDVDTISYIDSTWLSADTGIPEYLVMLSKFTARLHPQPNAANLAQTILVRAREFPTDMSSSSDTPALLSKNLQDTIPHYMAYRAFSQLNLPQRAQDELILFNSMCKSHRELQTKTQGSASKWITVESDD